MLKVCKGWLGGWSWGWVRCPCYAGFLQVAEMDFPSASFVEAHSVTQCDDPMHER